jgi:hypothetical protein
VSRLGEERIEGVLAVEREMRASGDGVERPLLRGEGAGDGAGLGGRC